MTHDELVIALAYLHPDVEWGYMGDGSTLEPVEDEDGLPIATGLTWPAGAGKPPTLADLEAALPAAQEAATAQQRLDAIPDSATVAAAAAAAVAAVLPVVAPNATAAQRKQAADAAHAAATDALNQGQGQPDAPSARAKKS